MEPILEKLIAISPIASAWSCLQALTTYFKIEYILPSEDFLLYFLSSR